VTRRLREELRSSDPEAPPSSAQETAACSATEQSVERRLHDRVPLRRPVRLRKFNPSAWRAGVCTDISDGGLGLETPELLEVNDLVEVELAGTDGIILVHGRVVYRHIRRYGIALLHPAPPSI
jgi:hypothetical protein